MIRRPPRSTPKPSSAASDVYKRQKQTQTHKHTTTRTEPFPQELSGSVLAGFGAPSFLGVPNQRGESVPRGHVRLNSPPSDSDRCEIQPDKTDLPPSSHPSGRSMLGACQVTGESSKILSDARSPSRYLGLDPDRVGVAAMFSLERNRGGPFGTGAPVQWGCPHRTTPSPLTYSII